MVSMVEYPHFGSKIELMNKDEEDPYLQRGALWQTEFI